MSLHVKICGVTRPSDALHAARAGADAIGMIFSSSSPRQVSIPTAAAIGRLLPSAVSLVGVFVEEDHETIRRAAEQARISTAQIHAERPDDWCAKLQIPWYRAYRVDERTDPEALAGEILRAGAAAFLLDTGRIDRAGGTGRTFDWRIAEQVGRLACGGEQRRMILAGGLTPDNVGSAVRRLRGCGLWGVDVSSGVESSVGVKDPSRVRDFLAAARGAA